MKVEILCNKCKEMCIFKKGQIVAMVMNEMRRNKAQSEFISLVSK